MRLRDTFAINLRRARNAANLSQDDLAHRVGMDRGYVSDLENSKYSVSIDMIENLAAALGTQPYKMLQD